MGFFNFALPTSLTTVQAHPKVSTRTVRETVEEALVYGYTRVNLNTVLSEELQLTWTNEEQSSSDPSLTKRDVVRGYTEGWELGQLIGLGRRIVGELDLSEVHIGNLTALLREHDKGGGIASPAKNLIFAANGPKPDLVLKDSISNDIEIVRNAEHCLIYSDPMSADGLKYSVLINWWRKRERIPDSVPQRDVGLQLHQRLRASLADNPAECIVFDSYAARYKEYGFDIPALIPQVYLHFDPSSARIRQARGESGPLARQRMDFLMLFSDRHRVVLEVDGKQHYANGDKASPSLYSEMVAEDRRLKLTGYEVYRFGGAELMNDSAGSMLSSFFDQLAERMK